MSYKLSVVLPVFNAEPYVAKAIESILEQTIDNYEFIIVNDGSTDGSESIIKKYVEQDARIKLISRENRGLCVSLNEAIAIASAPWIARMDADDISDANRFERQLFQLEKTGADICGTWMELFGANGTRVKRYPVSDAAIKTELLFGSPFGHGTVIMRASKAKALPYLKEYEKAEDYDLWERATQAGWLMTNIPEILYRYREHEFQSSSRGYLVQQSLSRQVQRRAWMAIQPEYSLETSEIESLINLREIPPKEVDLACVARLLSNIYQVAKNSESRNVIILNSKPLYFRGAALGENVIFSWIDLNRSMNKPFTILALFEIVLIKQFRIFPESSLYNLLTKIYLRIFRWG